MTVGRIIVQNRDIHPILRLSTSLPHIEIQMMLCIKYHSQSVKGEEGGLLSPSTLRIYMQSIANCTHARHFPGGAIAK